MDDSLATLSGQPRPLVVDGKTYLVHPLKIEELGELEAWAQSQFADPIQIAMGHLDKLTVGQQKHLLESALKLASQPRPKLGTPEVDALCQSVEGIKQLLRIAIRKGDPTFDQAKADALFAKLEMSDLARVFQATNVEMVLSSPKAETPTPNG